MGCGDKCRFGWSVGPVSCGLPWDGVGDRDGWAVDGFGPPPLHPQLSSAVHTALHSLTAGCTQPLSTTAGSTSGCGRICVLAVVNSGSACGWLVHSLWSRWGELQVRAGDGCSVDNLAVVRLFCRIDEAKPTGSAEKFGRRRRSFALEYHRNVFLSCHCAPMAAPDGTSMSAWRGPGSAAFGRHTRPGNRPEGFWSRGERVLGAESESRRTDPGGRNPWCYRGERTAGSGAGTDPRVGPRRAEGFCRAGWTLPEGVGRKVRARAAGGRAPGKHGPGMCQAGNCPSTQNGAPGVRRRSGPGQRDCCLIRAVSSWTWS